jgi:hypothetical protein
MSLIRGVNPPIVLGVYSYERDQGLYRDYNIFYSDWNL